MGKAIDLTGKRFGLWTVIKRYEGKGTHAMWHCKCDCGTEAIIRGKSLRDGDSKSCGCFLREVNRKRATKHGGYGTRLYRIWDCMKARCNNPKAKSYPNYGARGIAVCAEWSNFAVFREWAMSHGYDNSLTLDRKDNSKGYSPDNCRWVDMVAQENNKSSNHYVTYQGETMSLAMWARKLNISYDLLLQRVTRGWPFEKAITNPKQIGKRKVG